MRCFNFFCSPFGNDKKTKGGRRSSEFANDGENVKGLLVKLEQPAKSGETEDLKSTFVVPVPFAITGSRRCKVRVMSHGSPVGGVVEEVAYEGEDEHEVDLSMKRDDSDFDLQARVGSSDEQNDQPSDKEIIPNDSCETEKHTEEGVETIRSGHVSDPGIGKADFWTTPGLVRSCSDLATSGMFRKLADQLPPHKSHSFEEMQHLACLSEYVVPANTGSPVSVISRRSADKVMLKKHSSSQILPSRSRRLWWKLFLWSHRNLQAAGTAKPQPIPIKPGVNQQGGYTSDTLEARRSREPSDPGSVGSFIREPWMKANCNTDNQSWDGFQEASGFWPQNQWVALPAESSALTRVDQWVKELSDHPLAEREDYTEEGISFPPSPDPTTSPVRSTSRVAPQPGVNVSEEILHANRVILSLNSSSTVAHIPCIGLKVIPTMSHLSSLKSVNLSGNFIVQITPGSLPKGLHTLNLSRNKITAIDGLRELTRLRVLDLSYNRISRIGQGLSTCTLIKELYLAGNKISFVEGLHRLLKLTILDLSFNKITTKKALGQLVANYNSLVALNLLGNQIQTNISEDQLRKTVCGLLPKLAFLNKQHISPQKAREAGAEAIAKAALGSGSRMTHKKSVKRVSQGGPSSSTVLRNGSANVAHKSRQKSRSRKDHHSYSKAKPSNSGPLMI